AISLAVAEVAELTAINDTYGTRVGDRVLQATGAIATHSVRTPERCFDRAYRHNGGRFFLLLSDTKAEGAANAAERLRMSIANADFRLGEHVLKVSLVCGVTDVAPHEHPQVSQHNALRVLAKAREAGG